MTPEDIDYCLEIILKYNPQGKFMTRDDYYYLIREDINGNKNATETFADYCFNYACDWLYKEYINKEYDVQNFEDDVLDMYLFSRMFAPASYKDKSYVVFRGDIREKVEKYYQKKLEDKYAKNLDLNYEKNLNVSDILSDVDYETKALDNFSRQQIESMIGAIEDTGLNDGKEHKPERNREIFLKYLALNGDDKSLSELGEEYGFTGSYIRQVCVNHKHYLKRCLRVADIKEDLYDCAGMPVTNTKVKLGRYIKEIMREK
jgi:hypothetical protein